MENMSEQTVRSSFDTPAQAGPPPIVYPAPVPTGGFRMHRSRTTRMIGGVCGGLAESLDVDVTLLRLGLLVLTVLGGGIGIPVYLAAWIIVPEAEQG